MLGKRRELLARCLVCPAERLSPVKIGPKKSGRSVIRLALITTPIIVVGTMIISNVHALVSAGRRMPPWIAAGMQCAAACALAVASVALWGTGIPYGSASSALSGLVSIEGRVAIVTVCVQAVLYVLVSRRLVTAPQGAQPAPRF